MSNPAVIRLDGGDVKGTSFKRFAIEDNIGESIHLHIDGVRFDFTIKEFLAFSDAISEALDALNLLDGYKLSEFDGNFLEQCASFIHDISGVRLEHVAISKLKFINRRAFLGDLILTNLVGIEQTSAYRYLEHNDVSFLRYPQVNYHCVTNAQRLESLRSSVVHQYPDGNQYITVFGGQNVVVDGQHRAAALASAFGPDYVIQIMRLEFRDRRIRYSSGLSNGKALVRWLLRRVYRSVRRLLA